MESSARTASKQHWIVSSGHLSESEHSEELYLTTRNISPKNYKLSLCLLDFLSLEKWIVSIRQSIKFQLEFF